MHCPVNLHKGCQAKKEFNINAIILYVFFIFMAKQNLRKGFPQKISKLSERLGLMNIDTGIEDTIGVSRLQNAIEKIECHCCGQ